MAKIVSIHSFRGGTGKSNVTANLTALIAQSGKRVGVIDTDIQSPGIHVLFGLDEEDMRLALNDYLWGRCSIEEAAYDVTRVLQGTGETGGAIYLIPSSVRTDEITRVLRNGYDVGLLNEGFRDLIHNLRLDYLMIDTHPGLNEETLLSIAVSDALLIILRPDQQDYQGTAVTVEVARKLDVPWLKLVVNKVLSLFDFAALQQEVVQTYDVPVAGVLPESEGMLRLGSSDVFCLRFPDHPFTLCLRDIADQLLA
jgi:MinD-like ATPase involved in chromosome partitioning or flagellar assembly